MRRGLYVGWQCTWGVVQTLVGFVLFLMHGRRPHRWYHGAVVTEWDASGSISLGLFVFVASHPHFAGRCENRDDCLEQLLVHEYGHTIQSLLLGPLYLLMIGIPSWYWANGKRNRKKRREQKIPYCAFFTERWANRLGEAITKRPSLRDTVID